MILDSSAIVAILLGEPQRTALLEVIATAPVVLMSAASYVEVAAVIEQRRNPVLSRHLDELLAALDVELLPLDAAQAHLARAAYRDFGRSSGHPARLKLGDCYSYAAAKASGEPLLWVGGDFGHTDLRPGYPGR